MLKAHRGKVWLSLATIRDCLAAQLSQPAAAVEAILHRLPREPQRRKLPWEQSVALVLNGRLKLATARRASGESLAWDDPQVLQFFRQQLGIEDPVRVQRKTKRRGSRRRRGAIRVLPNMARQWELASS